MVSGFKSLLINMSIRCHGDRSASRLDQLREMAEDLAYKSQTFLGRGEAVRHTTNPYQQVRLEDKWTSKRARVMSVLLFALSVCLGAALLGAFYLCCWHPRTRRIFSPANSTACLK